MIFFFFLAGKIELRISPTFGRLNLVRKAFVALPDSFHSIYFSFIDLLHFQANFPLAETSFCWEAEILWFQFSRWIDVLAEGRKTNESISKIVELLPNLEGSDCFSLSRISL